MTPFAHLSEIITAFKKADKTLIVKNPVDQWNDQRKSHSVDQKKISKQNISYSLCIRLTTTSVFLIAFLITINAQIRLPNFFDDRMVLQRDTAMLWGWTDTEEEITISFLDRKWGANPVNGKWSVELGNLPHGGPHVLHIYNSVDTIKLVEVLIGDVYLCSGQSNMDMPLKDVNNALSEIANSKDPLIRYLRVNMASSETPADNIEGFNWRFCSPETVENFSAVGYFFAKNLRKHTQIPIGIINASFGGTKIEGWMSKESLVSITKDSMNMEKIKEDNLKPIIRTVDRLKRKLGDHFIEILQDSVQKVSESLVIEDKSWLNMEVPGYWETKGYNGFDGIFWYRKIVNINEPLLQDTISLHLGAIDDTDVCWLNGIKIGETKIKNKQRIYRFHKNVLEKGDNVILVRIKDIAGRGGFGGERDSMYLTLDDRKVALGGNWQYQVGTFNNSQIIESVNSPKRLPYVLFNAMINPLVGLSLKGMLWYQGEGNTGGRSVVSYEKNFKTLITDWRSRWKKPDLPFFYVQIANYSIPDSITSKSNWALIREAQLSALQLPNTGMAVAIDIGSQKQLHPRRKKQVGNRLSLIARNKIYGETSIVYSGPIYKEYKLIDGKVLISFNHTGSGLIIKKGQEKLGGFAIAGEDGNFVQASATITDDKILVWNELVKKPVYIRYAWADNPVLANLYNKEGLPASPFRIKIL